MKNRNLQIRQPISSLLKSGQKSDPRGFILLETLVALVILVVGILFLINSLSLIIKCNTQIRNHALAAILADNILTRIETGETIERQSEQEISGKVFRWELDELTISDKLNNFLIKIFWQDGKQSGSTTFSGVFFDPEP